MEGLDLELEGVSRELQGSDHAATTALTQKRLGGLYYSALPLLFLRVRVYDMRLYRFLTQMTIYNTRKHSFCLN